MSDERVLALALCEACSELMGILPAEERPCPYHLTLATAALVRLRNRGYGLGLRLATLPAISVRTPDSAAEASRLDAENLRQRVPPVRP